MKIAFLASDLALPGQGMQLARLVLATKEAGHEVLAISLNASGEPGEWLTAKGVAVKSLHARSWRLFFGLALFALTIIRFRPTLLQTWGFRANLIGKTIGFFCGAKTVVSSLRSPDTPRGMELERISSFLCAKTVASSSWLSGFGKTCGLAKGQLVVIGNSCDFETFKVRERKPPVGKDGKWNLLFLGERSADSGVPELISALAALAKADMPFKATFAGCSTKHFDAEMLYHIRNMELASKIEIKSQVPHSSIPALMEHAHLLLAPNAFCWTPNTILEAFASGLPVLAANIEGVKELVSDGKTGRLVIPLDPQSLAKGIADATLDYNGSIRMAREALKLVKERNSPKRIHQEYLDLYASIGEPPLR